MIGKRRSTLKKKKEYICPCGKQYLSYPALYTHIKTNHQGKAPGQIQRPIIPSRGRPKICQQSRIKNYSKSLLNDIQSDPLTFLSEKLQSQNFKINNIDQIQLNLKKSQKIYHALKSTSKQYKQIQSYVQKQKGQNKQEGTFVNQDNIYLIKTGNGLANLLIQIQQKFNQPLLCQIILLICLLIKHMKDQSGQQQILQTSYIGFISEFFNDFVINGFKQKIQQVFKIDSSIFYLNKNKQCDKKQQINLEDDDQSNQQEENQKQFKGDLKSKINLNNNQQEEQENCIKITDAWIFNPKNAITLLDFIGKWLAFKKYTMTKATLNIQYCQ